MNWLLAAHSSELSKPGDYVLLSSGAEQIAAFNLDDEIIATDNVCVHRGARILSNSAGNTPLVCPYHGRKGEAVIGQRYATDWVGEWLFVGDGSTNIKDDLGKTIEGLLYVIGENITKRHAFDVLPMPCDWKVAVENALEDYHIPMVHPDTFGKLKLELIGMEQQGKHSFADYKIGDERTVKSLKLFAKHFVAVQPENYFHILLYPGTAISSVGHFSYSLQHYMPNSGFTALHTRLYQPKMTLDAPNYDWFFNEAMKFNRMVFEQDSAICARVVGEGTILTEQEKRITWFRASHS